MAGHRGWLALQVLTAVVFAAAAVVLVLAFGRGPEAAVPPPADMAPALTVALTRSGAVLFVPGRGTWRVEHEEGRLATLDAEVEAAVRAYWEQAAAPRLVFRHPEPAVAPYVGTVAAELARLGLRDLVWETLPAEPVD